VIYDTGIVRSFSNVLFLNELIALVACVATIALPYRRKELYDASPKVLGRKLLGLPGIAWMSALAGAFCVLLMYLTITKTQYSGGLTTTSVVSVTVMGFSGLVIYVIVRAIRARQGIDITLAMRELPPE
jgi:basic amino acid/polyamine antiporter, APA family